MKLAPVGIACLMLLAALVWFGGRERSGTSPRSISTAASIPSSTESSVAALARPEVPHTRSVDIIDLVESAPVDAQDRGAHAADLSSILKAIGRADARRDDAVLSARLPEIVGSAERLTAALDLLESGRLAAIPDARRGALIVLSVGVARWSRGGGPSDRDGVAWTTELLVRLPRLDEDARAELVVRIAGAEVAGRGTLDGRYLAVVLELCREHPEDASTYVALLDRITDDAESLRPHLQMLQTALGTSESADVRALALRALFLLEPTAALTAALQLVEAAHGDPALRGILARAIARAAPPEQAVELLLELRDASQYAAFAELASRPGAGTVLREHYNRLAAASTDSVGRRILVASMGAEDPGLLFGIAETDPSGDVRQQAFLTGTLRASDDLHGVDALRSAYDRRADPSVGIPVRGVVISADNVVLNSRGPRREAALALMEVVARDESNDLADRLFALRRLRPYVPADRIADLDGLGDAPDEPRAQSLSDILDQAVK